VQFAGEPEEISKDRIAQSYLGGLAS
jgi:hypothetical protein